MAHSSPGTPPVCFFARMTRMIKLLDALYDGAAWLAALFMIGVLLMVLLSIVSRLLHFHVPGR